ncbi:hypothetical protein [Nocardioides euryhalodurans]|uniref:Hemerythrin domain-containing protein n=1 Tax=Nocardioides euryhalodurans TaxID=2518370 RepID=A0A4P7GJD3_9ACTN|nr:hypothetical protein [Nocardioides euryhalodurans]QBR91993.1 hypothetical protein EXE57_06655 [Nocardioides euryhalodurans]
MAWTHPPAHRPLTDETTRDGADLLALLDHQHAELRELTAQLPGLGGAARADVFLLLRRRLAVHELLDELVVSPRLAAARGVAPENRGFLDEVEAAEAVPVDGPSFDVALSRLAAALGRHADAWHRLDAPLDGQALTDDEQAAVLAAEQLWEGEGEVHLGQGYRGMAAAVRDQLLHPLATKPVGA